MRTVPQNIDVDVIKPTLGGVVYAKQNDKDVKTIVIHLQNNGIPYDFSGAIGLAGFCQGITDVDNRSGKTYRFKYNIKQTDIDTTAKTITIPIQQGMVSVQGITRAEVMLYDTAKPSETLCTFNFVIQVQSSGYYVDESKLDDYKAIQEILVDVQNIKAQTQTIKDDTQGIKNATQAIKEQTQVIKSQTDASAINAEQAFIKTKAIQESNVGYTKEEIELEFSHAPRKNVSSATGEINMLDSDRGKAYTKLSGKSEQYKAIGTNLFDVKQMVKNMQAIAPDGIKLIKDGDVNAMQIYSEKYDSKRCLEFKNDITKSYKAVLYARHSKEDGDHMYFICQFKDKTNVPIVVFKENNKYTKMELTIPVGKEIDFFYFSYGAHPAWFNVDLDRCYLYQVDTPSTEKPTGGYGSPTPEYPSEIQSLGDIPKDGYGNPITNLCNEEDLLNPTTSTDGTFKYITIHGELNLPFVCMVEKLSIENNLVMRLSKVCNVWANPDNTDIIVISSGNITSEAITNFTPVPGSGDVYLKFMPVGGGSIVAEAEMQAFKNTFKLMVTQAKQIDEYRPYTGTNKGLIKLETVGKNILDNYKFKFTLDISDRHVYVNGTNRYARSEQYIKLKGNTQYTFSCYVTRSNITSESSIVINEYVNGAFSKCYYDPGSDKTLARQYRSQTFTTVNSDDGNMHEFCIILYANYSTAEPFCSCLYEDIQLEEGATTAPVFEPHKHETTWVTLKEPLRSVGEYKDTIDEKGNVNQLFEYYAVPVKNFEVANIASSIKNSCFYTRDHKSREFVVYSNCLCETFPCNNNRDAVLSDSKSSIYVTTFLFDASGGNAFSIFVVNGYAGIDYDTDTKAQKKAKLIAFLGENYMIGANYRRINPIIYQIPAIHLETYDEETNIRCYNKIVPSELSVDYKQSLQQLFKKISNAIGSLGGVI